MKEKRSARLPRPGLNSFKCVIITVLIKIFHCPLLSSPILNAQNPPWSIQIGKNQWTNEATEKNNSWLDDNDLIQNWRKFWLIWYDWLRFPDHSMGFSSQFGNMTRLTAIISHPGMLAPPHPAPPLPAEKRAAPSRPTKSKPCPAPLRKNWQSPRGATGQSWL